MASSTDNTDKDEGGWITEEFLEDILHNDNPGQKVSIISKNVTFAVGKGENYLSKIFRVQVQYKLGNNEDSEKCQLIVKSYPDGEFMREYVVDNGAFARELSIYHSVLPEMCSFVEKRLPNLPFQCMAARSFVTSRPNTVVLEDLRHEGFTMADRKGLLDLQHCQLVITTLARFHGISAALSQHSPGIFSQYRENGYTESSLGRTKPYYTTELKFLVKLIRSWPGYEMYADKLEAFIPVCIDKVVDVLQRQKSKFEVLCHRDTWVNNFLFKYSSTGEPVDMRFIDFQLTSIGTPALDLLYLFCTSPRPEVRNTNMDLLLETYHSELCETLSILSYDGEVISFEELKYELKRTAPLGILVLLDIVPAVLADAEDSPDFSELTEEDLNKQEQSAWHKVYASSRYQEILRQLLPYFDELGLFD